MNNTKAEQAFLAALIKKPELFADYHGKVVREAFSSAKHLAVYDAITRAYVENVRIDAITAPEYLPSFVDFSEFDIDVEFDSVEQYWDIVRTHYMSREMVSACQNTITELEHNGSPDAQANLLEERILALTQHSSDKQPTDFAYVLKQALDQTMSSAISVKDGEIFGVDMVNSELNMALGGGRPKKLVVLGARPGMGKSAYAINLIVENSIKANKRGLLITPEMTKELCGQRIMSNVMRIDLHHLETGYLNEAEMRSLFRPTKCLECGGVSFKTDVDMEEFKVVHSCIKCGSHNVTTVMDELRQQNRLDIIDTAAPTIEQIVGYIKSHKIRHPDLEYVVVDHLHEIGGQHENKVEKYEHCCKMLRDTAKSMGIFVLLLAQLSRSVEASDNKRPKLIHLRESGAIEQIADVVLFLYRDSYYSRNVSDDSYELDVAKQRNGPRPVCKGSVNLAYQLFD